jgi:hypothetical protein
LSGARTVRRSIVTRDQLVAASLVGTVVVLVGFASGLGITRPASSSAAATNPSNQPTSSNSAGGTGGSDQNGAPGAGGIDYVAAGSPGGVGSPGSPNYPGGLPTAGDGPTTPTTSAPPTIPPPTTTGSAPGTPPVSCQSGILSTVVNGATGTVNGLVGGVPVVGGLLGGLGLTGDSTTAPATPGVIDGLTNTLLGTCATFTPLAPPPVTPTPTTTPGLGGGS